MDKDRKELLKLFKQLDQVNKINMLAHIRVAYAAQEATKQHYGLDREPPAQAGK